MSLNLYDELRELVGKGGTPVTGPDQVCKQMIRHWCEAMEDANPLYSDEDFARKSRYGNIISPPAMVQAWSFEPVWPDGQEKRYRYPDKSHRTEQTDPAGVAFDKLSEAGFSATVDVDTTLEFAKPLYPGDTVTVQTKLVNLTPEKKTRLGSGHFMTYSFTYTNQKEEPVCYQTLTIFKFKPDIGIG